MHVSLLQKFTFERETNCSARGLKYGTQDDAAKLELHHPRVTMRGWLMGYFRRGLT